MLSKLTILEMLEHQVKDFDMFTYEMGDDLLSKEIREINKPVQLMIAWLTDELKGEAKEMINV